jgi:NUMOD4 motif.
MTEIWKDIPGYDRYQASSLGRVRAKAPGSSSKRARFERTGGVLSQTINRYGYPVVAISTPEKQKTITVHRCVLLAFVGIPAEDQQACHNNGIRTDNRVENLRWDTVRANLADRLKHGTHPSGENHPQHKLTAEQVRMVRQSPLSSPVLGRQLGVHETAIKKIRTGATWRSLP